MLTGWWECLSLWGMKCWGQEPNYLGLSLATLIATYGKTVSDLTWLWLPDTYLYLYVYLYVYVYLYGDPLLPLRQRLRKSSHSIWDLWQRLCHNLPTWGLMFTSQCFKNAFILCYGTISWNFYYIRPWDDLPPCSWPSSLTFSSRVSYLLFFLWWDLRFLTIESTSVLIHSWSHNPHDTLNSE